MKSDLDLIAEFRVGNLNAFEDLIKRYNAKAYSLALRLTKSAEDAEEVLQDVFVTVYRKIAGFEGKSTFSSWLYRVTVNASFMKLRKKRQDKSIALEDILPEIERRGGLRISEEDHGDASAARSQVVRALEEAIATLPEDYRPVFILRDVDGLTSEEVGRMLEISIPAVKSRLHRSRIMVRRRLARFYNEYQSGEAAVGNG